MVILVALLAFLAAPISTLALPGAKPPKNLEGESLPICVRPSGEQIQALQSRIHKATPRLRNTAAAHQHLKNFWSCIGTFHQRRARDCEKEEVRIEPRFPPTQVSASRNCGFVGTAIQLDAQAEYELKHAANKAFLTMTITKSCFEYRLEDLGKLRAEEGIAEEINSLKVIAKETISQADSDLKQREAQHLEMQEKLKSLRDRAQACRTAPRAPVKASK